MAAIVEPTVPLDTPSDSSDRKEPLAGRYERTEAWVNKMRSMLCPAEMVDAAGKFDQMYFKPRNAEHLVWGAAQAALLKEGIAHCGVGNWSEIRRGLLPEWDELEIRVKTCRLFGKQNLSSYAGWKGTEEDIKQEYEKNKQLGAKHPERWKFGLLVDEVGP